MARTQILPSDPGAIKLWESEVAVDSKKKSFFTPMTGGEKELLPLMQAQPHWVFAQTLLLSIMFNCSGRGAASWRPSPLISRTTCGPRSARSTRMPNSCSIRARLPPKHAAT